MSRWRAAAIHLGFSLVIATALFALTFFLWYPSPYYAAAGASFLWFLLVGIDVVIGPFLTLLVFKVGKPGLKFDMVFIVFAQLAALIYGFSVIAEARPAYVVFAVDRFNVVPANWVVKDSLNRVKYPEFEKMPWTGPILASVKLPEDREKAKELMFSALQGYDVETHPEYFVPYLDLKDQMLAKALPLSELLAKYNEKREQLLSHIEGTGLAVEQLVYLPMTATRQDMAIVLDAKTAEIITTLPVDPWFGG